MTEATRKYHLEELRIATDPSDPRHLLPDVNGFSRILDLGCGAGQALIALQPQVFSVGLDPDVHALKLGLELAKDITLVAGRGEALPFADGSFDLVFSRVALPYMDVPLALSEMRRVLMAGGVVWLSVHTIDVPVERFRSSGLRGKLFALCVIANGYALHVLGRTFPIRGSFESFQTWGGIRRAMQRAGFSGIQLHRRGRHFVVSGLAAAPEAAV